VLVGIYVLFMHACTEEGKRGMEYRTMKKKEKALLNKKKKRKKGVLGEGNCHLPI
jgi:hypothetical protein